MDIEFRPGVVHGEHDMVLRRPWHNPWVISSLTEHDLRDLEFVLAQRRATSKRCPETDGEHTCGFAPGHLVDERYGITHLCRACTQGWARSGRPEEQVQGDGQENGKPPGCCRRSASQGYTTRHAADREDSNLTTLVSGGCAAGSPDQEDNTLR